VLKRPNLTVAVTTTVEKVLFDESGSELRAIGVEVSKSSFSPKYRVRANCEVILCGGTVATPHILLVSGIGPQEELSKVGIKVVKDLSQVGKNYCDVGVLPPITDISLCVLTMVHHSILTLALSAFAASADTRSISSIRRVKGFLRCYDGWSSARVQ
jgi:choline dehydrogenase-like flavoprotein